MNILLINHYAGSQQHGMEFRPYYLAKEWVKKGHQVTIIGASFSHLRTQNIEIDAGFMVEEQIEGIHYIWLKTSEYANNGLSRLKNTFEFSFLLYKHAKKLCHMIQPDVVLASSPHPFIFYGAKKIAQKGNCKIVFEVRDLWPLSMIKLHSISPKHPFMQLMQITEDYCYRNADAIASVLPYAEDYYREHGAKKEIGYFPNSIDLHSWNYSSELINQDQLLQIEQLKQAGKFLVGYTGTVGIANAVDTLIDAAERVKQHDNIVFVIVGDGDQLQTLKTKVQQLQLNNVVFLGKISKDEIPAMLSYFDTVYLGWKNIDLYKFGVSPNKVMDYMMAKKPIIHAITSDNDIVKEYDCGISVEAENCEALAEAVLNLSNCDSEQLEDMGNRGYEKVINNHTYEQVAQQYVTFLKNI